MALILEDNSEWLAFYSRLGYRPDSRSGYWRKPAVPAEVIALPKPHVIEKMLSESDSFIGRINLPG